MDSTMRGNDTTISTLDADGCHTGDYNLEYEEKYMENQKAVFLLALAKISLKNMKDDSQSKFQAMNELMKKSRNTNENLNDLVTCLKMLRGIEENAPKLEEILSPLCSEFDEATNKLTEVANACSSASHIMPKQLQESLENLDPKSIANIQSALETVDETVRASRLCDLEATALNIESIAATSKRRTDAAKISKALVEQAEELFEEEAVLRFNNM